MRFEFSAAFLCCVLAACSSSEPVSPDDAGATTDSKSTVQDTQPAPDLEQPPTVTWTACLESEVARTAECAKVALPLDHQAPGSATVDIHVQRFPSAAPARGQLWLLHGGLAGHSRDVLPIVATLTEEDIPMDIYVLDHRGSGNSGRLGCTQQEDPDSEEGTAISEQEISGCVADIVLRDSARLPHLTTTAAAHDLGALIELLSAPDDEVFVYGLSYGTYWGHRYLQLYPEQADGVILDSLCWPGTCFIDKYDQWFNETGVQLLKLCGEDPFCKQTLGDDPVARATEISQSLDQGHCPMLVNIGFDRTILSQLMAVMLSGWSSRAAVPALLHRLERCETKDATAIVHLTNLAGQSTSTGDDALVASRQLGNLIALSELWSDPPPDPAQILSATQAALFAPYYSTSFAAAYPHWQPHLYQESLASSWAQTDIPLLLMHGTLDPQTPVSNVRTAAQHFQADHQHVIEVPLGAHGVIIQSPTMDGEGGMGQSCGLSLLLSFLEDPTALDKSCLSRLAPLDFQGSVEMSRYLFNTDDYWE